jgi:hypothetical protein
MKFSQAGSRLGTTTYSSVLVLPSHQYSTLKTGKQSVPETLQNFHALTQLSVREDFIE